MKKFFEILLYIILTVLAAGVLLAVFLTVSEYRPADVENVPVTGTPADRQIPSDQEITLISWNLGYGALGKDADFVMDGGGNAPAADKALVEANLAGIADTLKKEEADFWLLQEAEECLCPELFLPLCAISVAALRESQFRPDHGIRL